jgi:hypothetical protein
MKSNKLDVLEANRKLDIMEEEQILRIIEPANMLKEGFTLKEVIDLHGKGKGI